MIAYQCARDDLVSLCLSANSFNRFLVMTCIQIIDPAAQSQILLATSEAKPDLRLAGAIARAHVWLDQLSNGQYVSVEQQAAASNYNPKVIRQGLRLAFLAPETIQRVFMGDISLKLKQIPKALPLSWREQRLR